MHLLIGALHVPELCFWPDKTKNLKFLRCIFVFLLVFVFFSDIKQRNWLQLLFYFILLIGIVDSVIGMSFFMQVSGIRLKFFSHCRVTAMFAIGNRNWFNHDCVFLKPFKGFCLVSLRCIPICDLVLNYCSDKNEVNWLRLLFYFNELMDMVTSAIGRCFYLCFSF